MGTTPGRRAALLTLLGALACHATPSDDSEEEPPAGDAGFPRDSAAPDDASSPSDAGPGPLDSRMGDDRLGAAAWIRAHFAEAPTVSGELDSRQRIETPVLVADSTACCAKYAFDLLDAEAPSLPEAGFVQVAIHDLSSPDAFGGGIQTGNAAGATVYVAHMTVDPSWPAWRSYAETNYDGLVLDGSAAFYAEDLTIRDWNADAAIDDKADVSQFVNLTIEGSGHRGIRFWRPGPHYLVDSQLSNRGDLGEGVLMWFRDCSTVEVRIYGSTFDGEPTVPPDTYSCDQGSDPTFVYLDTDPRTTGEMHEMFSY